MTRSGVLALVFGAAAALSIAAQTNPPYLAQFPSVERVKSEMQGKDAMDTAARQMGAFWQLQEIIKGMSGLRWTKNALTADEKQLLGQYAAAYGIASQPYANYPDRPAWYRAHAFYETNRDFRDEMFRRLLTPQIQEQWAQITGDTHAGVGVSKAQPQVQTAAAQPASAPEPVAPPQPRAAAGRSARTQPNVPPAHSTYIEYARDAMYALAAKNYDKAIDAYKKVVEMEPDFDEKGLLIFLRVDCDAGFCDQKLIEAAEEQLKYQWIAVLQRYVATHSNDAIAVLILGDAHNLVVSDEEAMPLAVVRGHRKDALAAYRQAASLKPGPVVLANTFIRMATTYQEMKDNGNAAVSFTAALRLQPDNKIALAQLGHSLYNLKRYPGALEAYEKLRRLEPKGTGNSYFVGQTLNAMKQYEKAVNPLQNELRIDATAYHADANYELGVAYRELNQYSNAVSAFQQAIRLKEKDKKPYAEAVYGLGTTYLKMGRKDQALQIAARLQPLDKVKAQQLREQVGNATPGAAQPAATKGVDGSEPRAATPSGSSAAAYVKQGDEYSEKHDHAKALEAYKRALALDVNNGDAYRGLGAALYEQKRFAEALQPLQRAVHLKPDDNNALWVLGRTYVELGNKQQALRIYRTLVARAKDDSEKEDAADLMARMWERFPELRPK